MSKEKGKRVRYTDRFALGYWIFIIIPFGLTVNGVRSFTLFVVKEIIFSPGFSLNGHTITAQDNALDKG